MATKRKRRPTLTPQAVEGLRAVRMEAHAMVTEREAWEGPSTAGKGSLDEKTWRGIAYLDALIEWFEAREKRKG